MVLALGDMRVLVVVLPLEGIQAEVNLIRQDGHVFDLGFPLLENFNPLLTLCEPVLLFRFDPDPVVHRNGALLKEQFFERRALDGRFSAL